MEAATRSAASGTPPPPGGGAGGGANRSRELPYSPAPRLPRRLPRRDDRRHVHRQHPRLLGPRLPPAPSRRMERLDLHRHDLPLLPLHRGRLDGVLLFTPARGRRGPRPASPAHAAPRRHHLRPRPRVEHALLLSLPPGAGAHPRGPPAARRLLLLPPADLPPLRPAPTPP